MAMSPWVRALWPTRGSMRLIVSRWALWILAALPAVMAASGALGERVGQRPYLAGAPDPLPLPRVVRLLQEVPGPVWGLLATGAVMAWLGHLLLTAGAVEVLRTSPTVKLRVRRAVFDTGTRFVWAYLRIALLALALLIAGSSAIGAVFDALGDRGRLAGWTGERMVVVLPMMRGLVVLAWAGAVGVLVWWCRVIAVADGRRYVRRIPGLVIRLAWRHPIRGVLLHFVVAQAGLVLGALVLVAWRQSAAAPGGWIVAWLGVLLVQSFLWHWRLRASVLIWSTPRLADLRERADAPWGLLRRLWKRRAARRAAPPPVAPSSADHP